MTGFRVSKCLSILAVLFVATDAFAQTGRDRVPSESFIYVRLGYGSIFGDQSYPGPAMGFGYRTEFDSFGFDVSFLNLQFKPRASYSSASRATTASLLKLEGLYFMNPRENASAYVGAGFSYGITDFGGSRDFTFSPSVGRWHGGGLQGELTVGYEFLRQTSRRMFVQVDATLPFYKAQWEPFSRINQNSRTDNRYAPALSISMGFGW